MADSHAAEHWHGSRHALVLENAAGAAAIQQRQRRFHLQIDHRETALALALCGHGNDSAEPASLSRTDVHTESHRSTQQLLELNALFTAKAGRFESKGAIEFIAVADTTWP